MVFYCNGATRLHIGYTRVSQTERSTPVGGHEQRPSLDGLCNILASRYVKSLLKGATAHESLRSTDLYSIIYNHARKYGNSVKKFFCETPLHYVQPLCEPAFLHIHLPPRLSKSRRRNSFVYIFHLELSHASLMATLISVCDVFALLHLLAFSERS